jgi:hypothetical protein
MADSISPAIFGCDCWSSRNSVPKRTSWFVGSGRGDGGAAAAAAQDRDLSEEVAWPELREKLAVRGHDSTALGQDEERVARRALAAQPLPLAHGLLAEPHGELFQLGGLQRLEERDRFELFPSGHAGSNI